MPLALYCALTCCGSLEILFRKKRWLSAACCLPLFWLLHTAYGCGLLCGIMRRNAHRRKVLAPLRVTRLDFSGQKTMAEYAQA